MSRAKRKRKRARRHNRRNPFHFYVYMHSLGGVAFYVGMGLEARTRDSHSRNPIWHKIVRDSSEHPTRHVLGQYTRRKDARAHELAEIERRCAVGYGVTNALRFLPPLLANIARGRFSDKSYVEGFEPVFERGLERGLEGCSYLEDGEDAAPSTFDQGQCADGDKVLARLNRDRGKEVLGYASELVSSFETLTRLQAKARSEGAGRELRTSIALASIAVENSHARVRECKGIMPLAPILIETGARVIYQMLEDEAERQRSNPHARRAARLVRRAANVALRWSSTRAPPP